MNQLNAIRHSFQWPLVMLVALVLSACSPQPTGSASSATSIPTAVVSGQPSATQPATTAQSAAATTSKLNLNSATAADFLKVPNVGSNMVREFMEYRPYTTILQFRREIGKYVSAQQVAEYEQYVYVPIDVNSADAATLQQIPGVDATVAAQLMAARPYASNDAFLQSLAKYVSAAGLAAAKAYLAAA